MCVFRDWTLLAYNGRDANVANYLFLYWAAFVLLETEKKNKVSRWLQNDLVVMYQNDERCASSL